MRSIHYLPTMGDLKIGLNHVASTPASFKCCNFDVTPFKSPMPSPLLSAKLRG